MFCLGIEFCGIESNNNLGFKNKQSFQSPNVPGPPYLRLSNHHVEALKLALMS
jgi:hypothetical protein